MNKNIIGQEYNQLLNDLKQRVASSRYKAALNVNKELILLYHHIGIQILEAQAKQGWGAKVIDQLSKDLSAEFPEMKGFSTRNLKYMRKFAHEYSDVVFVQQVVALLPWGHNVLLMNCFSEKKSRMFYIKKAIEHGWSRSVMMMQIELSLHKRQGQAITNFKDKLPYPQSDLANYTLKDPYIFDFLSIGKEAHEREVEKALVHHMEKFILELGAGFAFVGRQYHLEVGGQDFYIDLLFYNLKLRCFVVVELKDKDFKPEYAGKMNFYLSAVDDLVKHASDQPSIGLILCKSKNNVLAEYTLRDMTKPIGLAEYRLTENLPENLKTTLPTVEELEAELSKDLDYEYKANNILKPSIIAATLADYPTIQNMAQFYVYDVSRACGFPILQNGLYESRDYKNYFEEPTKKALLIKCASEISGFILLNQIGINAKTNWKIDQFFILAKFQCKGIGRQVVNQIFDMHSGIYEVSVMPENQAALSFWRKVIGDYTNGIYSCETKVVPYDKHQEQRMVFTFDIKASIET